MDWDDGRLFLAIARSGQLLAAARTLGLSQATLSRRMTRFERAVGTRLLIRRANGTSLTDAGQALARSLERVESEFQETRSALAGEHASLAGSVRIGAPDGFGIQFLSPSLVDLADEHPELNVQLVPVPRTFSMSKREADIAVMVGRPERGPLVVRKLTDYSLSLYAAKSYFERRPEPASPGDLSAHRLIGYVEDLIYSPALDYTSEFWRGWQSDIEISSAAGQFQSVLSGAGIAVLHDFLATGHPGLMPVLPELRVTRSYWVVFHESLKENARVRACADFLTRAVRSSPTPFLRPLLEIS